MYRNPRKAPIMASSRALTTATGLMKLLHSPQMAAPFAAARSLHTAALSTSSRSSLATASGLTKLLRSHLSPPMATPSASRSLCTVPIRRSDSDSDSDSESDAGPGSKQRSNLKGANDDGEYGPRIPYEIKLVRDEFYRIRLDLPGLGSKDLDLWVDKKKDIVFAGKCKNEPKHGYEGGLYNGTIPGCPLLCDMDQIKAELNQGVLWISLPLTEEGKKAIQWQRSVEFKLEKTEL
ncbi:uncharacterized protein LOC132304047 [Cornus florida]|uniref:uncharacterized protein LOC132304047 n=1 Tax=Cornus florida TaxID=4283 RepID=UPI00289F1132|nr:uncharacterized protein LOC132304047 [Cornus florida]